MFRATALFENLAISNWFPVDRFIPGPRIPDKLLVSLTRRIQFLEIVAFEIWSTVERDNMIISPNQERARDGGIVVLAEDEQTAEQVFP